MTQGIGVVLSVIGAAGLFAGVAALSNRDGLFAEGFALVVTSVVGLVLGTMSAALGAAYRTRCSSKSWMLIAVVAAASYFLIFWSALVLPNWSGIETLMYCEGGCPPPDGFVQLLAATITAPLLALALSLLWARNAREGFLLTLAAIPLANVAVFVATRATPSTHPSTTTPRSPAQAETEA